MNPIKRKEIVKTVDIPEEVVRRHAVRANRRRIKESTIDLLLKRVLEIEADEEMEYWHELCHLAGYKDMADVQAQDLQLTYDSVAKTLAVSKMVDDLGEYNERLARAWAKRLSYHLYNRRHDASALDLVSEMVRDGIEAALAGKMPEGNVTTDDTDTTDKTDD